MNRQSGFTLLELIVTIAILGILTAIAIPAFSTWYPNYRLKSATLDIYAKMQYAKMRAVKTNRSHAIEFDTTAGNNGFKIVHCGEGTCNDGDESDLKDIRLATYDEGKGDIVFSFGNATETATEPPNPPGLTVTYSGKRATFSPRGTSNGGYVYLSNSKGTAFAIGTQTTGLIMMKKWRNGDWE